MVEDLRASIQTPYFVIDELPSLDFNREIIEPGQVEQFPDGAVGIRADDDFWPVAAIPLRFREVALPDIVAALWPTYAAQAEYCPDHGSVEQRIYFAEGWAKSRDLIVDSLDKEVQRLTAEVERLRTERPDLRPHLENKAQARNSYFIRQYEHLLVAVAHEHEPRSDAPGVCAKCGLYGHNRVHHRDFIDRHNRGYEPEMKQLTEYDAGIAEAADVD